MERVRIEMACTTATTIHAGDDGAGMFLQFVPGSGASSGGDAWDGRGRWHGVEEGFVASSLGMDLAERTVVMG
jgi:hypothetical protein